MENAAPKKKSWFSRNWMWFVPVGVVTLCLVCGGCVAAGAYGFFSLMRSNPAVAEAISKVQSDPRAQQALGTPIVPGWTISGSISDSTNSGSVNVTIPVSGPKGSGLLYVTAYKQGDRWIITNLVLTVDKTFERIVIIGK